MDLAGLAFVGRPWMRSAEAFSHKRNEVHEQKADRYDTVLRMFEMQSILLPTRSMHPARRTHVDSGYSGRMIYLSFVAGAFLDALVAVAVAVDLLLVVRAPATVATVDGLVRRA